MHSAYGANINKDNTDSEEKERHRGAYGDIDSSEARERCMLGRKSFPGVGWRESGRVRCECIEREKDIYVASVFIASQIKPG